MRILNLLTTVLFSIAGFCGLHAQLPLPYNPPGPPIATGKSKFLGGVHSGPQKVNFTKYWNQVTPENAGKWGSVERTRDVMSWAELDSAYKMAKDNGYPFKMHTLIWGSQQPSWIETLPAAEQLEEINEWFDLVAKRYPEIEVIEVVNEPLHAKPDKVGSGNYINALGGNGATGWDWIITSFELARKYFPKSELWLNDYSIINDGNATAQYVTIINLLKQRNLIDAVGEQGHAFTTKNTPVSTMANNLNTLAATGLPLYITELDIDGPGVVESNGIYVVNAAADSIQLEEYKRVFPLFWTHPAIKGITVWGYRPGHWRSREGAYLAYSDGNERPALKWLRNYVANTSTEPGRPKNVWLEAECGAVGSDWMVISDPAASRGKYVTVTPGLNSTSAAPTGAGATIVLPFTIDSAANYNIAARVNCPTGDDDSYWVKIDDGAFVTANGLTTSGWSWVGLLSASLGVGQHTVTIAYREDGAKLDKLLITTSNGVVTGLGDVATNCINQKPVVTPGQNFTINDRIENNAVVGTVTGSDADEDSSLQGWQIEGGTGAAAFAINASTGELRVKDRALLDFENTFNYTLNITVQDGEIRSKPETVVIHLTHVPVVAAAQVFAIKNWVANGEDIGHVLATDKDENTVFQGWKITGGSGSAYFAVDDASGQITVTNSQEVNAGNNRNYTLQLTVSDGTNTSSAETVTITISEKVNVCHLGNTISINRRDVPNHIQHGDKAEACVSGAVTSVMPVRQPVKATEDWSRATLEVYPNPVRSAININLGANAQRITMIEVVDISGKVLKQVRVMGESRISIPRENLRPGYYLLRFFGEKRQHQKIVVQ